jgi:MscS family membrane protein
MTPRRGDYILALISLLLATLLAGPGSVLAETRTHPLEPLDTSSPRATLSSFLADVDAVWQIYRDQYWHSPSAELNTRINHIAARALRTLDLSQVAPSARVEAGYDAGTFLYETLNRIELPPLDAIPDAAFFADAEGPAQWTIPHTEISIARITEGPRKGEFLFNAATVERGREFYLKTRDLPYRRDVPIENSDRLRQVLPGRWIAMASIDRLPAWMKTVLLEHAVWKWLAFLVLLIVAVSLIAAVHRLTRRGTLETSVSSYLHRLAVPLSVLLIIPAFAYLATEQINLIGAASKAVLLTTQAVKYLIGTWVAWLGALLVAELFILSPRIEEDSLNAQLLRLTARIAGIVLGLVIIFYGASQIGIPLVGVLAGVGVGGLAIALAAQDSLKNLLGSLMIFMDRPYQPGERIVVENHDGFVEHIGLRSTKIQMLDGAITSIPNERMASLDIENIGRRTFIRRQTNITLSYGTPPDKIEKAVDIIKDILQDHEGMRPELPPRVFFNEFNPDSLNIQLSYWYHPPKRWKSLAFDERVNLEIVQRFATEGIEFAFPTSTTYVTQKDGKSLQLSINGDTPLGPQ